MWLWPRFLDKMPQLQYKHPQCGETPCRFVYLRAAASSNVDPDDDIITPTLRRLALASNKSDENRGVSKHVRILFFGFGVAKEGLEMAPLRLEQSTSSLGPSFAWSRPIAGKCLRRSEGVCSFSFDWVGEVPGTDAAGPHRRPLIEQNGLPTSGKLFHPLVEIVTGVAIFSCAWIGYAWMKRKRTPDSP